MKILFFCGNPQDPLLSSLRKYHQIISCGSQKSFDIQVKEKTPAIEKVLQKASQIDLIFILEQQPLTIPKNLEKTDIPCAIYLVDSHLHFETWHKYFAQLFDIVFFAQKKYVTKAKEMGLRNVFWLPLYSDPKTDKNLDLKRAYDLGFVGTLNPFHNPRRSLTIWLLKKLFKVRVGRKVFGKNRAEILNQAKIAFNISAAGDLNFRTFESMACGAMLLTDSQNGLSNFFKDRKHLIVWRNPYELVTLAHFYLKNETERKEIAKLGQKEVVKNHTSDNRARDISKILNSPIMIKRKFEAHDYYLMARTYLFNYRRGESDSYFKKFLSSGKNSFSDKLKSLAFLTIAKLPPSIFGIIMVFLRRSAKIINL